MFQDYYPSSPRNSDFPYTDLSLWSDKQIMSFLHCWCLIVQFEFKDQELSHFLPALRFA
eukprot:c17686_g1_i1 orf=97-273(-)